MVINQSAYMRILLTNRKFNAKPVGFALFGFGCYYRKFDHLAKLWKKVVNVRTVKVVESQHRVKI